MEATPQVLTSTSTAVEAGADIGKREAVEVKAVSKSGSRMRGTQASRQSRREKAIRAGTLRHRMTDAERIAALSPAYQRPAIAPRKAPDGFEIVCSQSAHCFHHIAKSGAEDTYITERCCGCPKTRTLRKLVMTKEN